MSNSRVVQVQSEQGLPFSAHLVEPEQPNGCGIVVLQEIFGVTKKIRAYCELFAAQGYVAIAPDLFWRMQPNVELSYSEEDVAKAVDFLQRFDDAAALSDIVKCAEHLRALGTKRVALVGFCLGGKLAPLSLLHGAGELAVGFYGVGLDRHAEALATLRHPVQLHFGDKDTHMSADAVARLEEVAKRNPCVEVFRYPEAGHAFFRADLRDDVSREAFARVMNLLNTRLAHAEAATGSGRPAR